MESILIPLLKRKPNQILLHVRTNDLKSYSPQQVADKILDLTKFVNSYGIRCFVSEIIKRNDYLSTKGQEVNRILSTILPEQVSLISHHNISEQRLNRSGLHLNKRGTGALAYNIIHYVKTLDFKNSCI